MELIVWEYMDVLGEADGEPSVSVEVPHNELQPETFDTNDTQVRAEQPTEQVCSTSLRAWVASVRDIYTWPLSRNWYPKMYRCRRWRGGSDVFPVNHAHAQPTGRMLAPRYVFYRVQWCKLAGS
eukprot:COSAG01_NODE_686_length_14245_cov_95.096140_14_plen_124_part_00